VRASRVEVRATVRLQSDGDFLCPDMRFWSSWSTVPLLYLEPLQDPDKIIGQANHLLIIFRIIRPLARSPVVSETSQTVGEEERGSLLDRGNTQGGVPR